MTPRRKPRKRTAAPPPGSPELLEDGRERQRAVCHRLLERWVPVAASEALALQKEGRAGPVIEEEPLEAGLKAGAFVLKVLERLARIDGLDAVEKRELTVTEMADPVELAKRVRAVSPVLMARLRLEGALAKTPAASGAEEATPD